MRAISSLVFVGCVVGFLATAGNRDGSAAGFFFVVGIIALVVFSIAQKLAEWVGETSTSSSSARVMEYFVDDQRNILASRAFAHPRSVGEAVVLSGTPVRIVDAERDGDGDFVYLVKRA